MKKTTDIDDPIRWRKLPASRTGIESDIGRASRVLGGEVPSDDLRLAQLRQRVLATRTDRVTWPAAFFLRPSFRMAAVVLASVCVGGVASAITGRFIARIRKTAPVPTVKSPEAPTRNSERHARRWRVAVDTPAQLDLSIGPDGTELVVVEGDVNISGGAAGPGVNLAAGASWRGDGRVLPAPAPVTGVVAAPPTMRLAPTDSSPREPMLLALAEPRHDRGTPRRARVDTTPSAEPNDLAPIPTPTLSTLSDLPIEPPALDVTSTRAGASHTPAFSTGARPPAQPTAVALLGQALRQLRSDRNPKRALTLLDEHDRLYGGGTFTREAALARAEALLVLERKTSALAVLDGVSLAGAAVDRWAQVARGELRAASGRHADAIADFDAVLNERNTDDDLAARALLGRAGVRAQDGDAAGARRDTRTFLQRFATNPHRADAELLLRRLSD